MVTTAPTPVSVHVDTVHVRVVVMVMIQFTVYAVEEIRHAAPCSSWAAPAAPSSSAPIHHREHAQLVDIRFNVFLLLL